MTTENKALVETFFERITRGDIDAAFAVVNDDVEWWVPGTLPLSGTKVTRAFTMP
jgi:ketosteroid isomerase-like protein